MFEDSAVGSRAARTANIATIVSPSAYTIGEDFRAAACVVSYVGEADDETHVLVGPSSHGPARRLSARRRDRLDGAKGLENFIGMRHVRRNEPRVADAEGDFLILNMQDGFTA